MAPKRSELGYAAHQGNSGSGNIKEMRCFSHMTFPENEKIIPLHMSWNSDRHFVSHCLCRLYKNPVMREVTAAQAHVGEIDRSATLAVAGTAARDACSS